MTDRKIEASDIASAHRGLRMAWHGETYLRELMEHHSTVDMFASKVIAEAARQELAVRFPR